MKKTISEKISELRKVRGLTQEQLGATLGISGQAVSKWEKGESMPDIMILPSLCEIFGISVDALFEVPGAIQKEHALKVFAEYACKKDEDYITLFEAFRSRYNESFEGKILKYGDNFLVMYDSKGMGMVINNEEYMRNLRDYDVEALSDYMMFFSNKKMLGILKHLSVDKALTKEELLRNVELSEVELNELLFLLIEKRICACDYDENLKYGYILCVEAYNIIVGLLAFFQSTPMGAQNGMTWLSRRKY
ncbi:MAG: helix-turn-helix domain-containing protein [Cellulosilyticaceae bacterium]